MAVKVYKKRGNQDYKTKKKIKELQEVIQSKIDKDPDFKFEPATNKEDLEKLYALYCSDEVDFEEMNSNNNDNVKNDKEEMNEKTNDVAEDVDFEEFEDEKTEKETPRFVDPFNRDEPKVRDYVLGDSYSGEKKDDDQDVNYNFDEPKTEKEAFSYGESNDESDDKYNGDANNESSEDTDSKSKINRKPLVNPDFDSMSKAKQKKATKRFAEGIVNAVTSLAEKGFVWFANKDITEAKIVEYEMSGEMDLEILLNLGDGQEATVKEFFKHQRLQAEHLSKIDDNLKEELVEALTEVFLEKGIAPTPTQNLIIVGLNLIGTQAITLIGLTSQTNSILTQLRDMKKGSINNDDVPPMENDYSDNSEPEQKEEVSNDNSVIESIDDTKLIGESVETKE